jgi:hypothetical protein
MRTGIEGEYNDLVKERKKHRIMFELTILPFLGCLSESFHAGPVAGWPWLIGSIGLLLPLLWSLIEYCHYDVLAALSSTQQ